MPKILLAVLTLAFAIQGYLFNIQKDPSRPNGFSNLNQWGKLFLFLTFFFACLSFWADMKSSEKQEKEVNEGKAKMDSLSNLVNCNGMLYIKVKGVLHYDDSTGKRVVGDGFRNLFNDFASISITFNQNGRKYNGNIDEYTSDINFIRYRNIKEEFALSGKKFLKEMDKGNSYYFEVACPVQLRDTIKDVCYKITNVPNIDSINVELFARKYSSKRLYKYTGLYVQEIVFKNYKNLTDSVGQSIVPIYKN